MKNVPKIRFKGFTDAWEQRKFKNLALIERGGSPRPIEDFITNDLNGLNWIKIGDAPELGRYITSTQEKIRPEGLSKTREVHPGDLILSNSMSFGKPYIMGIDGCIHDGWLLIRLNRNCDLKYFCYLLGSEVMLKQYRAFAAGSTVNNLNKQLVSETVIPFPMKHEQGEIGKLFEQFDNFITLHQRKCEQLKTLKKFLLQKMFPENGNEQPELRFAGFTDAWEQRKFNSIYKKSNIKNNLNFDEKHIISVANMYFKSDAKISDSNYLKTYNLFKLGDIAFEGNKSKNFLYGRFVENTIGDGIVSHVFDVFTPIVEFDLYYWKYAINNENIMSKILRRCTKSSTMMTNLVASDFLHESIRVPTIHEQNKIGLFLHKIDNLITLHQRKYEEFKKVKQYLLQNMFPQE